MAVNVDMTHIGSRGQSFRGLEHSKTLRAVRWPLANAPASESAAALRRFWRPTTVPMLPESARQLAVHNLGSTRCLRDPLTVNQLVTGAIKSSRKALMALSMNWIATAASSRPIMRMAMLITIGLSQRALRAESRRIR